MGYKLIDYKRETRTFRRIALYCPPTKLSIQQGRDVHEIETSVLSNDVLKFTKMMTKLFIYKTILFIHLLRLKACSMVYNKYVISLLSEL